MNANSSPVNKSAKEKDVSKSKNCKCNHFGSVLSHTLQSNSRSSTVPITDCERELNNKYWQ